MLASSGIEAGRVHPRILGHGGGADGVRPPSLPRLVCACRRPTTEPSGDPVPEAVNQRVDHPDHEQGQQVELNTDARQGTSGALLLHGDPGIGKSALLRSRVARGRAASACCARAASSPSPTSRSPAWLSCSPRCWSCATRIPAVQAAALGAARSRSGRPPRPTASPSPPGCSACSPPRPRSGRCWSSPTTCSGSTTPRATRSSSSRAAWAPRASCCCAPRATAARTRGVEAFPGVEQLPVTALGDAEAAELLARESGRDRRRRRRPAVETAHGNPLALTRDPAGAVGRAARGPRAARRAVRARRRALEAAFARQLADLPAHTREALLIASAMQTGRHDLFVAALERRGLPADALEPARRRGWCAIDGRVDFAHPLLRSAIYHAADPVERRAATRRWPRWPARRRRRAWHLAEAPMAPDEEVAEALETAAAEARSRRGLSRAARAFERAANLSTDDVARARRLLEAASDFAQAGNPDHALDLARRAAAIHRRRRAGHRRRPRARPGRDAPRRAEHRARACSSREADRIEADRPRRGGVAAPRGRRRAHDDRRHGGADRHRRARAGAVAPAPTRRSSCSPASGRRGARRARRRVAEADALLAPASRT